MLELVLLRHAEAASAAAGMRDNDRPLTAYGRQQALRLGAQLKRQYFQPQLIITSPALRTFTTAQLVAEVLDCPLPRIRSDAQLYSAEPSDILQILAAHLKSSSTEQQTPWFARSDATSPAVQRVLVVGHNPGLSEVSQWLTHVKLEALPPAGAVFLQWQDNDDWDVIVTRSGTPTQTLLLNLNPP